MVSAAGKYRRNVFMSQPSAPKTDVLIKSRPYMICSAIHATIPSRIPIVFYAVHWPPWKKGVIYAMMKPNPFNTAQVMMIRLSQDRDSCTVRSDLEKFIRSSATAAVTTAAMVEMPRI